MIAGMLNRTLSRHRGRGFAFNRGTKIPPAFDARLMSDTYNPLITHSRASVRTYFDSTGTLQTAAIDTWPVEYDPSTLRRIGRNISEARTNSIRNNTMQGASAGTPGTVPTNWQTPTYTANQGTLATSISGLTTENGVTYLDLTLSGTPTGAGAMQIALEAGGVISASNTQVWTFSSFLKVSAGSTTNVSLINFSINERAAGFLQGDSGAALTVANSSANLAASRNSTTFTLSNASTTNIVPLINISYSAAAATNITLRIGMPQLELGLGATPVIATSSAAVPRSPDLLSITGTNFSGFWNPTQGTFVARYMLVDASNGSNQFVARASDNTYNNHIGAINTNSTGFAGISTASGGVFDGAASAPVAVVDNVFTTVASSYSAAGISVSKDGAAVVSDNTLTFPTGMTRLDIGGDHAGANHFGSGWISDLLYYQQQLPVSELRSLGA